MKVYFLYHTLMAAHEKPRFNYLFKEVYEEMFITRSLCRDEDSVVFTIPLSFIEEHFGFEIGFSFYRLTLPCV